MPTRCSKAKAPKTNEKGEIISWDSHSPDSKALRALFDGGLITTETANKVKNDYPRFRQYASRTLNSALSNERKRMEKEVDTQIHRGSSGEFVLSTVFHSCCSSLTLFLLSCFFDLFAADMKAHSNLNINLGTINDYGSYFC